MPPLVPANHHFNECIRVHPPIQNAVPYLLGSVIPVSDMQPGSGKIYIIPRSEIPEPGNRLTSIRPAESDQVVIAQRRHTAMPCIGAAIHLLASRGVPLNAVQHLTRLCIKARRPLMDRQVRESGITVVNQDRRGPGFHIVRVLRGPLYLLLRRSSVVCWSGEVRGCPRLCGVVAVSYCRQWVQPRYGFSRCSRKCWSLSRWVWCIGN